MHNNRSIGYEISNMSRYTKMYMEEALKDMNINGPGQIRIVMTLSQYKQGLTQDKLAHYLKVDKATISRTIRPLVNKGIIERKHNPDDKRAYIVTLSEEYFQKMPEIKKRVFKWTEILKTGLTDEELDLFFQCINKLKDNAEYYLYGETNE